MALVTVEQLRAYLDQVKAGIAIDDNLTDILERAEGIVTDALGFTFLDAGSDWSDVTASQKLIRSEESRWLKLPPYLYGSITSVAPCRGSGDKLTLETAITDYDEMEEKHHLYRENGWGGRRYAITAKWGYGAAPTSVVQLILELAVNIHRQKAQGLFQTVQGVDTGGQSLGTGSIKYVGGLNADQRRIIQNERRKYIEVLH